MKPKRSTARQAAAEALRSRAQEARGRGDLAEAETLLRELLKSLPGDLEAREELAGVLLRLGRYADCAAQAEEIVQRFPNSPQARRAAAGLFDQTHDGARAIAEGRLAADLAVDPAPILADLASVYERAHRLEEAREAVQRALSHEPDLPQAQLVDGLLWAREKQYERAEERFAALFKASATPPQLRVRAGHELARTYDRVGRFDEAMQTLASAKALQRRGLEPLLQRAQVLNRQNEQMAEAIEARDFRGVIEDAPPAVGVMVGFPRTGSTLLESALDRHPGLISAEETPAQAAAVIRRLARSGPKGRLPLDLVREMTAEQARGCREAYLRLLEEYLREAIGARLVLDKNPSYTHAVPYLKRIFPRLKTVTLLRDPRDIVISCYMMHAASVTPFNVAFLDWEQTARHFARTMRIWLRYRAVLERDFVEVRYEDMVADLEAQVRRVLAYLELPWTDDVLSYQERAKERPATSPTYADVTQPVYTRAVARWKNYGKHLEAVLPILEPVMRDLGYG